MTVGRVYTGQFNAVGVSAQQDFFELVAPATAVLELLEIHLSQTSEFGDALEQNLSILLKSGQTTSGSGGTAPTPAPVMGGFGTAGATLEVNNTTKATAGTIITRAAWTWNIRVPFDVYEIPEGAGIISPSGRMTLELATTPTSTPVTMNGFIKWKEIGG